MPLTTVTKSVHEAGLDEATRTNLDPMPIEK